MGALAPKIFFVALAVLVGPSGHGCQATASEPDTPQWSVTVGGTSDYVFRGISYNDERPAAQASVDVSYGILSAGIWGSNVADVGYEPTETDFYVNIKPVWGAITFDFGAIWYTYPGANPGPLGYDSIELKAGVQFSPVARLSIEPSFWYVPDQKNAPVTYTFESAFNYELPAVVGFTPTVVGLVGYTDAKDADAFFLGVSDYAYWNGGLEWAIENFAFDLRYWNTNIVAEGLADERFTFTTSLSLP